MGGTNNKSYTYKTIKKIDEDDLSKVYLIQKNKKYYALKKFPLSKLPKAKLKLLSNQVNNLKNIKSNYIIKYYDSFNEKDYFNILIEYEESSDLKQFLDKYKSKGQLIYTKIIEKIIKQICLGLSDIHKANLIHKELSTNNIFIDNKFNIKISDYGLSNILGTKSKNGHYIAPEIEKKEKYNNKADIYSLGCIIYELFTLKEYYLNKKGKIDVDNYNRKWQNLIDSMVNKDNKKRPNIDKILEQIKVISSEKNYLNKKITIIFKGTRSVILLCNIDSSIGEMINQFLSKTGIDNNKAQLSFLYNGIDLNREEYSNKIIRSVIFLKNIAQILVIEKSLITSEPLNSN